MEALVAVPHHRNQYCNKSKSRSRNHFDSSPSSGLKGTNCRAFHSGATFLLSSSRKDLSLNAHSKLKSPFYYSEPTKKCGRSKPISVPSLPAPKGATFTTEFCRSELWAGPAYSNSPPPSSLPIPKFSLRERRCKSLELPLPMSKVAFQPRSMSAPASPTRESTSSLSSFLHNNAAATENLRRILNLDITND